MVYSQIEWEGSVPNEKKRKQAKRLGSIRKQLQFTSIEFFFVFLCVQNTHDAQPYQ